MELYNVVSNVKSVFSLPEVVFKVNELINSGEATNNELEKAILNDSALTAKLLKFANSAYFGFSGKIETVSHAIALIGHMELRNLVLASSVTSAFKGISSNLVDMASFWNHSISTGILARLLAFDVDCRERIFIAGLLHSLGKLILFSQFPNESSKILTTLKDENAIVNAEKQVFGFTASELSAEFLKVWDLPDSISKTVKFQLNPLDADQYRADACILHLAVKIASYKQHHSDQELDYTEVKSLCNPEVWEFMDLSDDVIGLVNSVADLHINEMLNCIKPDTFQNNA